jgi:predicted ATPase
LSASKDAITATDEGQERAHESQIYRLNGEILLKQPDPDLARAQNYFETAIEIAHRQGARSFELQAVISYARLLSKQGNCREARGALEAAYGWFTEGFDTADLRNAKFLLDELAS